MVNIHFDVVVGHSVTLNADTPYGPYRRVVFTKDLDGWSAIKEAKEVVEWAARVRPGPRPKYLRPCRWVVEQLAAVGKVEQASQPAKPMMPVVVSSLLH